MNPRERGSPQEVAFVLSLAFGGFILAALYSLVRGATVGAEGETSSYGERHLLGVLAVEMLLAPIVCYVLHQRGWRDKHFPLGFSMALTLVGIGMAAVAWVTDEMLTQAMHFFFPAVRSAVETLERYEPARAPRIITILAIAVFNSFYEELFACAYVIEALRKRFGETTAVNVSIAIRASYHLYQGIWAVPFHLAFGFIQAYVYLRFGRLWPLVVAHGILNVIAFSSFG
jgi:membrane protease YdiL (CAAX protease family)